MSLYIILCQRNRILFIWTATLTIVNEWSKLVQVLLLTKINFLFVFTSAANNILLLTSNSNLLILKIDSLHIIGIRDIWAWDRVRYRMWNWIWPVQLLIVCVRVPTRILFSIITGAARGITNQTVLTLCKVTHVQVRLIVTALLINSLVEFLAMFIQWVVIVVEAAGYRSISDKEIIVTLELGLIRH